jgi:hypothetical protein
MRRTVLSIANDMLAAEMRGAMRRASARLDDDEEQAVPPEDKPSDRPMTKPAKRKIKGKRKPKKAKDESLFDATKILSTVGFEGKSVQQVRVEGAIARRDSAVHAPLGFMADGGKPSIAATLVVSGTHAKRVVDNKVRRAMNGGGR